MKLFLTMMVLIFGIGFSSSSYCKPQPWKDVGGFAQSTTTRMMDYLGKSNVDTTQSDWKFTAALLRIQAQFGIEVPWLAGLKIVPEVEVILEEN